MLALSLLVHEAGHEGAGILTNHKISYRIIKLHNKKETGCIPLSLSYCTGAHPLSYL